MLARNNHAIRVALQDSIAFTDVGYTISWKFHQIRKWVQCDSQGRLQECPETHVRPPDGTEGGHQESGSSWHPFREVLDGKLAWAHIFIDNAEELLTLFLFAPFLQSIK